MAGVVDEDRRRARRHHAVELALGQHVRQRAVIGNGLEVDARRQTDRRALAAARLLDAARPPFDVGGLDAVLVLEEAADEDIGGLLIFGNADGLALEVFWLADAAIGPDIDAAVAEDARGEGGNADILRFARTGHDGVAAHRHFRDVELGEFEGAMEAFLGEQRHGRDLAALDLDLAIEDRDGAVVNPDGETEFELLHIVPLTAW